MGHQGGEMKTRLSAQAEAAASVLNPSSVEAAATSAAEARRTATDVAITETPSKKLLKGEMKMKKQLGKKERLYHHIQQQQQQLQKTVGPKTKKNKRKTLKKIKKH